MDYERLVLTLCTSDEPVDSETPRVELPFTLAHASKPLILVPVMVGDLPFQFALYTGASTTVISPEVARRCEVASSSMPSMTGGGGTAAAAAAVLPSLNIGCVGLSRVRVVVAEFLDALSRATGARLDGILGTNVLRRFRVTIDYPRRILRLE